MFKNGKSPFLGLAILISSYALVPISVRAQVDEVVRTNEDNSLSPAQIEYYSKAPSPEIHQLTHAQRMQLPKAVRERYLREVAVFSQIGVWP